MKAFGFAEVFGGRTRARTWDPLIKSQQVFESDQPLSKTKGVKPASNGQWLSADLSNRTRVFSAFVALPAAVCLRLRERHRSLLSWVGLALLATILGGCERRDPWAPYTDRVLQVGTFVPCNMQFSGLPSGRTYYHVDTRLQVDADGIGRLRYYDGRTVRDEPVQFASASTARYSNVRCVAVWQIPWSTHLNRPYYLEDEPARVAAHYGALVAWHNFILFVMAIVMVMGITSSWCSYEQHEHGLFAGSVAGAVAAWMVSALIGQDSVRQPWSVVQKALDYYAFYDALPKQGAWLQPLSADAVARLFQPPPLPSEIGFSIGAFALTVALLGLGWLAFNARRIVIGAYWMFVPLPLDQLHARISASGELPTTDELMQALSDTLAGKSSWQVEVMRRKAQAFRQRLEQHIQQGD